MTKYRNRTRINSARLQGWDYRHAAAYFLTICTQNHECFFGECQNARVTLTTAGMIVQGCWYQIPYLYPHVNLGAFVVMPNHIHGILILNDTAEHNHGNNNATFDAGAFDVGAFESNAPTTTASNDNTTSNHRAASNVPKLSDESTPNTPISTNINSNTNEFFKTISPKSGSVSRIIQQYKTVCTKHIRQSDPDLNFKWQSRFYDHIIRNKKSFYHISNYILNNAKNWKNDKFLSP